jgi:hypothetical protein
MAFGAKWHLHLHKNRVVGQVMGIKSCGLYELFTNRKEN